MTKIYRLKTSLPKNDDSLFSSLQSVATLRKKKSHNGLKLREDKFRKDCKMEETYAIERI